MLSGGRCAPKRRYVEAAPGGQPPAAAHVIHIGNAQWMADNQIALGQEAQDEIAYLVSGCSDLC